MLREAVIEHCAPTLAGLKTGSIFTVKNENGVNSDDKLRTEMFRLNMLFYKRGLRIVPIRKTKDHTLIYLYRPDMLRSDLNEPEAIDILEKCGYDCENSDCCLVQLVKHLALDEDFPHEIGLFLGYPPYDVKCFMKDTRKGVKCVGCWKVYSNRKRAMETFEKFKKCTEIYHRALKNGKPLEELIVPMGLELTRDKAI